MSRRTPPDSRLALWALTIVTVAAYVGVAWVIGPSGPMASAPMFARVFLCIVVFILTFSVAVAHIPDPPARGAKSDRGTTPPRGRSLSPHPTPRADRARGTAIQDGNRGDQAPAASEIAAFTAGSAGAQARLISDASGGSTPPPAPTFHSEPQR